MESLEIAPHDVLALEAECLWIGKRLAPWTRDLIFSAGSIGCTQILVADSISMELKRLAGRGLIDFFSGFAQSRHVALHPHKPTVLVRATDTGATIRRIQWAKDTKG